jgi:hypothetical protein
MDLEVLITVALAAAALGVALTLLALGRGRQADPTPAHQDEPPGPPRPRARPGAGPCVGWFVTGGGKLGKLRFERSREVVSALAVDLSDSRDIDLRVGIKKKQMASLRQLPWPDQEAVFLARPADPFLLLLDRPLDVFDPRYDRYLIVPLGFMEAAGGLEAFMGALAFDVLANKNPPMDVGERLLRDAAEAALASGFAPPDVLRSVVQMLRQQVFAGRYRPYLAMPSPTPAHAPRAPGVPAPPPAAPPPAPSPGAAPPEPPQAEGKSPAPAKPAAPPLATPAAPQVPPDGPRKPRE